MNEYMGITHALPLNLLSLWKWTMCRRNVHVFDEVGPGSEGSHYLVCDACQLMVYIDRIDTSYTDEEVSDGLEE